MAENKLCMPICSFSECSESNYPQDSAAQLVKIIAGKYWVMVVIILAGSSGNSLFDVSYMFDLDLVSHLFGFFKLWVALDDVMLRVFGHWLGLEVKVKESREMLNPDSNRMSGSLRSWSADWGGSRKWEREGMCDRAWKMSSWTKNERPSLCSFPASLRLNRHEWRTSATIITTTRSLTTQVVEHVLHVHQRDEN